MKLDRNTNRGGRGKYALVNMRKLIPMMDAPALSDEHARQCVAAFEKLVDAGFITLGNESPGDQFFVMKYKDKFTAEGLRGYGNAVSKAISSLKEPQARLELGEYCAQIFDEAHAAEKLGNRIPD